MERWARTRGKSSYKYSFSQIVKENNYLKLVDSENYVGTVSVLSKYGSSTVNDLKFYSINELNYYQKNNKHTHTHPILHTPMMHTHTHTHTHTRTKKATLMHLIKLKILLIKKLPSQLMIITD